MRGQETLINRLNSLMIQLTISRLINRRVGNGLSVHYLRKYHYRINESFKAVSTAGSMEP